MAFTGIQIMIGLIAICAAVMGFILGIKAYMRGNVEKLAESKSGSRARVKKHQEADIFGWSSQFLRLGLVCSLGLAVLLFGWTQYEKLIDESFLNIEDITDIEQEVPRVPLPPPPPPPPPPPIIEDVPDEEIEEDITFEDTSFEEEEIVDEEPVEVEKKVAKVVAPVVVEEEEEEIIEGVFTVVEDMPSFPGCQDLPTNDERKACTAKNLLKFMYQNIKYPSIARENGIAGLVVVQFIVGKDGSIQTPKIMKDIGGGCADEVIRVVETMNGMSEKWTPGQQRGRPVQVRYNLPLRFKPQQN